MKRCLLLLIALTMVLTIAACQASPVQTADEPAPAQPAATQEQAAPVASEGERVIRIAHCAPDQDVAQKEFSDSIRAQVKRINEENRGYKVEYTIFNAQYDIQTQIGQVETVISQKYDVLIMFGTDSAGAAPIVKQAHDAGIKVIDICDMGQPDIVDIVFYGVNEIIYQDLRDEFLLKYCEENPDQVPLKTGIIYGNMNQIMQLPRGDRMKALAEKHPDKFTILASQTGEWYADKAMNITEDWMQLYADMNYICSANDQMSVGIVQALKSAGRLDKVLVTSIDCTDEALQMIKDGDIACTVGVDNYDYAVELIDVACRLGDGEQFDKNYYMQKIWIVTKDNVEEYMDYKSETRKNLNF